MDVTFALLPLVEIAALATFVLLAGVAVVRAPRSGSAGGWAAAALVAVSLTLAGLSLPGLLGVDSPEWVGDAAIVSLLAFPSLLLRFTGSFADLPRGLESGALAAGVVATVLVLFGGGTLEVLGALGYWVTVSGVTVIRLWGAGHGQPTVARRRMRMMASATAGLAVALLMAVQLGDVAPWMDLAVMVLILASAVTFGLGFAPPRALRLTWRRPEEALLQAGTMAVMRATTVDEIAGELLPPVTRIVGGGGAALVDVDGQVIARYGEAGHEDNLTDPVEDGGRRAGSRQVVSLGEDRGRLVVWTSPYTPFFGPEEIGLLASMGAVAGLALERCERLARERERRHALERAHEEAEHARQDADRANAAKSEFLSRMSHELRTPLNAILGFGQVLETSGLDEEDQEGVEHILKAGRHLLSLINDVLDLSRIEAGRLAISPEPVYAGELIDDALSLIRPQANERAIQLVVEEGPCEVHVLTDRQRCRQALLNLLSNAVKYNHDGGTVEVTCTAIEDGERLRIAVMDTGSGIDPDRIAQLFEPFERLGAETSGVEGTGLGLALTKQLMDRLGGSIGVQSRPREGSTFWIDLPVTHPPAAPDASAEPDAAGRVTAGGRTLLLVEDNLANLNVVEAMLRRRPDVSVIPAMQGRLALELAYQHVPDVVVLDLHLPDLSGREVLNRLRADPRTHDIPVVVASADATPGRQRRLLDDGAFDYLTKPLDLRRFLEVIDSALAADPRPTR